MSVITSLPAIRAKQLRDEARQLFAEADAMRAHATELDLAGLEANQRAYELEPW